jgi:hypothetical protein
LGFLFGGRPISGRGVPPAFAALAFPPTSEPVQSERLTENFMHDFQFAPFAMFASDFLFSDLSVELADFETQQHFLLPGHERLREESTIPAMIVSDRHKQDVIAAHSIIGL